MFIIHDLTKTDFSVIERELSALDKNLNAKEKTHKNAVHTFEQPYPEFTINHVHDTIIRDILNGKKSHIKKAV